MLTIVIAICALISVGYQYEIEFPLLMPEVQPVTVSILLCTCYALLIVVNSFLILNLRIILGGCLSLYSFSNASNRKSVYCRVSS